jgi:enoyl-CoA hydratase/carnithine racemase
LTINRPGKRNSLNMAVATQLTTHMEACSKDNDIKAVILRSSGDAAFCAGNDLTEFKRRFADPGLSREFDEAILAMHESVRTSPKVVAAVVNGFCLGGGITLLGSCDIAIASEHAEFGLPEVARGTWPAMATTALMHSISRKHALYLILTGRNISAREALAMGLVSKVVPQGELNNAAQALAKTFGGYDLEVLKWAKKIAYDSLEMDYERSMKYGMFAVRTFFSGNPSFEEGIGAFLQKPL